LNQAERFFALITARMIRRGTFPSDGEPAQTVYRWLANWNASPARAVWGLRWTLLSRCPPL
jgi:hypothetical protein